MNSSLYSLVKVGALTFAGAFFGALSLAGGLPTTLHGAEALLAPALGAAIAAEVYYLRAQLAAALAASGQAPAPPAAPAPASPALAVVPPPKPPGAA